MAYVCNCGREFDEHMDRVAHSASCFVMEAFNSLREATKIIKDTSDYLEAYSCEGKDINHMNCSADGSHHDPECTIHRIMKDWIKKTHG